MIVVMQCAATKRHDAGWLASADGRTVSFVARPEAALPLTPPSDQHHRETDSIAREVSQFFCGFTEPLDSAASPELRQQLFPLQGV